MLSFQTKSLDVNRGLPVHITTAPTITMPTARLSPTRARASSNGYGLMDNLTLTYDGNQLTGVSETVSDYDFTGSFEYKRANGSEYMYNSNGSLTADRSRGIAYIAYDLNGNPQSIYFMNGSVTKYVYSATGEKLRVTHYTAVPNISVAIGSTRELAFYEIQYRDSTDYLLGGSLTMKNGRMDKCLFDGGYARAIETGTTTDRFVFYYYNKDHLGNNREVVASVGRMFQVTSYYPFGAPYADPAAVSNTEYQPYKYNSKELDLMHGLKWYDYGARMYDPILLTWNSIDPLCEKYYNVSPYVYCHNNPVMLTDPDGRDDYYTREGVYLGTNKAETDYIYISDDYRKLKDGRYVFNVDTRVGLPVSNISAKALSKIFTHIVGRMSEVDLNQLDGKQINVVKWSPDAYGNGIHIDSQYGNCQEVDIRANASTLGNNITAFYGDNGEMFETRSNIQNMLGGEEYTCHFKNQWHHYMKDSWIPNKKDNIRIFNYLMNHLTWKKTTDTYKRSMIEYKNYFLEE